MEYKSGDPNEKLVFSKWSFKNEKIKNRRQNSEQGLPALWFEACLSTAKTVMNVFDLYSNSWRDSPLIRRLIAGIGRPPQRQTTHANTNTDTEIGPWNLYTLMCGILWSDLPGW